jgi:hypothetical protein
MKNFTLKLMKTVLAAAFALVVGASLTGCFSTGLSEAQQANFSAKMAAMTPEQRANFLYNLGQFEQARHRNEYEVTVYNY